MKLNNVDAVVVSGSYSESRTAGKFDMRAHSAKPSYQDRIARAGGGQIPIALRVSRRLTWLSKKITINRQDERIETVAGSPRLLIHRRYASHDRFLKRPINDLAPPCLERGRAGNVSSILKNLGLKREK
jgi:hypothetical protein